MVKEYQEGNLNYKEFSKSKGIAHGSFSKMLNNKWEWLGYE